MGFRPEPTVYNLTFKDTPLEGLEVSATCCSVAEYRRMLQIAAASGGALTEESIKDNDWILELFARNLKSWNLEDPATGLPVSPNLEGMESIEHRFSLMLVSAWQTALVSVPTTSPEDSSSGENSEESSLGLGNQSESLQS